MSHVPESPVKVKCNLSADGIIWYNADEWDFHQHRGRMVSNLSAQIQDHLEGEAVKETIPDPCGHLRAKAASALEELTQASEAMAEFSILQPYESEQATEQLTKYLERMQAAFERERVAWDAYYHINLELLECIRETFGEEASKPSN
jgi:hypothetical protein